MPRFRGFAQYCAGGAHPRADFPARAAAWPPAGCGCAAGDEETLAGMLQIQRDDGCMTGPDRTWDVTLCAVVDYGTFFDHGHPADFFLVVSCRRRKYRVLDVS